MSNHPLRIHDPAKLASADRQNLPVTRGVKHQFAATVQFSLRAPSAAAAEGCDKRPNPKLRELPTGPIRRNAACLNLPHSPLCEVN